MIFPLAPVFKGWSGQNFCQRDSKYYCLLLLFSRSGWADDITKIPLSLPFQENRSWFKMRSFLEISGRKKIFITCCLLKSIVIKWLPSLQKEHVVTTWSTENKRAGHKEGVARVRRYGRKSGKTSARCCLFPA